MNVCHVCGSSQSQQELIDEVFTINGALVLVKQIPAGVCTNCGEVIFGRETVEKVRRMVHDTRQPVRMVELPVYDYA